MTQILLPDISDELHGRLEARAREHGRTLEEEAKVILLAAVATAPGEQPGNLGSRISARFVGIGLDEPVAELRGWTVRAPRFDE